MNSVGLSKDYRDSLVALEGAEIKRVLLAVNQFLDNPDHPGLNFEALHGKRQRRLYTIRASKELRVLMAREGDTMVLLHAGHHDDVYALAERKYFLAGRTGETVGFFDLGTDGGGVSEPQPSTRKSDAHDGRPGVLDHWSDQELLDVGFRQEHLAPLRALRDPNNLFQQIPDLDDSLFDLFLEVLEISPDEFRQPAAGVNRLRVALTKFGGLGNLSQLFTPEEFEEIAARPIEAWMVFLHPDQRALVERSFSGPARVRGSAGTGKTVVALHRAAHLARVHRDAGEHLPILFTTYIRSLPPVFERLYSRLPRAVQGEVVFLHIDKVAREVCQLAGERLVTAPREINRAYWAAYSAKVPAGSSLDKSHLSKDYIREEIVAVVKGRGLSSVDEYLEIERTGRTVPLVADQRRQVWDVREQWDLEMGKRGTIDFVDVVVKARDHALEAPAPTYSSVIVDEAQDLSLVGLQLARALVNGQGQDARDGLFLVGDGAQRIYPGGFTLRQAGVEVRGRTAVLRENYRNTKEIIGAAMSVGGDDQVDDLGETFKRGDAPADAQREGQRPSLIECVDFDAQLDEIASGVESLAAGDQMGTGDMAVLVATNKLAGLVLKGLRDRGIECLDLEKYEGRPGPEVKVGTYHRGKGLEFKAVFLPSLDAESFPPTCATPEETRERAILSVSQLFVAMTRARDALIVLYSGNAAEVIEAARDRFDRITASG